MAGSDKMDFPHPWGKSLEAPKHILQGSYVSKVAHCQFIVFMFCEILLPFWIARIDPSDNEINIRCIRFLRFMTTHRQPLLPERIPVIIVSDISEVAINRDSPDDSFRLPTTVTQRALLCAAHIKCRSQYGPSVRKGTVFRSLIASRMVRLKPVAPLAAKSGFQGGFRYSRMSGQFDPLANANAAPFIILSAAMPCPAPSGPLKARSRPAELFRPRPPRRRRGRRCG